MGFLSKLFGRSRVPSVQQIVEKLLPMRLLDRSSWDEIRQWLAANAFADIDRNEANRLWPEIQEKCREAALIYFYELAKGNGLTQEAATEFAMKWTILTIFWFSNVDRPVDKTIHLQRLNSEPEVEIDLLIAEIERQDARVIRHLKEMWRNDPEISSYLEILRGVQIQGKPTNEMNTIWDTMVFSSWDKLNFSTPQ